MSLQGSRLVEKPRRASWVWAVNGILVVLLALGVALSQGNAAPAPKKEEPKKEEPRKEEPKKEEPKTEDLKKEAAKKEAPRAEEKKAPAGATPEFPDADEAIKHMVQQGLDAETARRMMDMQRSMERARFNMRGAFPGGPGFFDFSGGSRLGVNATKPSATLAEQLDLPKGQGIVVEEVQPDSPAAKAGLKAHDILLELNGKPVPDDVGELARHLEDIKPNKPVDVVVLRKGKRETIKGLSLPEAQANLPRVPNFPAPLGAPQMQNFNFPMPQMPQLFPPGGGFLAGAGGNGVMTTTFRTGDRYTTRHQEGSLIITVNGTVADGKAKVGEIQVQDGTTSNKYEGVDKVPDQYRDKVKNLVEMSEKSSVKIEIKQP